jgi:hypothetical protein
VNERLQLTLDELGGPPPDQAALEDGGRGAGKGQSAVRRAPRGITVGQILIADGGYRWTNLGYDFDRREFVCRLVGGSEVLRRFSARAVRVERGGR